MPPLSRSRFEQWFPIETVSWGGMDYARRFLRIDTLGNPSPIDAQSPMPPHPPPPGPAQILHQNTEGDLECVSGGGAKPPTRQTVVIPLYFGGESGLGLGVGHG